MDIKCKVKGSYRPFIKKLEKMKQDIEDIDIDYFGEIGVGMLKDTTPKDSHKTADSWWYKVETTAKGKRLSFTNSNVTSEGTPIAILLEYGHATKAGNWYPGYNFINPAINKVVKELIEKINDVIKKK